MLVNIKSELRTVFDNSVNKLRFLRYISKVLDCSGIGYSLKVASVIIPRVPNEPMRSLGIS